MGKVLDLARKVLAVVVEELQCMRNRLDVEFEQPVDILLNMRGAGSSTWGSRTSSDRRSPY